MTLLGEARPASPCLALDIGATKVEAALVAFDGGLGTRRRVLVDEHPHDLFEAIVEMARDVVGHQTVACVGVACAGPMSKNGEAVSPLNIASWRAFPLRSRLEQALDVEVFIDGDARALALAEGLFGGAQRDTSYLSMVVSTGVGGGFVLDGRLLDGDSGNAGHVGHLIVVPDGAMCSCGSFGCLEAEASGWAIESRTGRPASEADQATRVRTAELVGRAVGTLASVLDFNRCYVAGSVALGFGDAFFESANKSAHAAAQLPYSQHLEIRRTGLGTDGSLLGAAMVGWRGVT